MLMMTTERQDLTEKVLKSLKDCESVEADLKQALTETNNPILIKELNEALTDIATSKSLLFETMKMLSGVTLA